MTRTDSIARIRIELNGIDPTIWRGVEVPLTTSLKGLHDVIQAVMPFENRHPFLFNVGDLAHLRLRRRLAAFRNDRECHRRRPYA